MTQDNLCNDNLDQWKDIRARVEERRKAIEATRQKEKVSPEDELPMEFVSNCLDAEEYGDGCLFAVMNRDRFRYNVQRGKNGKWMIYGPHFWSEDNTFKAFAEVEGICAAYDRLWADLDQKIRDNHKAGVETKALEARRGQVKDRIKKLRKNGRRRNILEFSKSNRVFPLAVENSVFDVTPHLMPCLNGVVDLRTGAVRPGRPDQFLEKHVPVELGSVDDENPDWTRFIEEIFESDEHMVEFVQRLLGYTLLGSCREKIFVVLWGPSNNGKTVLVETVANVLGGLAHPIQSETLLEQSRVKNASGPSPEIIILKNIRFGYVSETNDGARISPAQTKWLSGSDTLVGRAVHAIDPEKFTPTHTLFLSTNHLPHANSTDAALWERMLLLNFRLSFVNRTPVEEHERRADPMLKQKLLENKSGILAWLIHGALKYQAEGLNPPEKVKVAVESYRRDEDILADFLEECCVIGEGMQASATELYNIFETWYERNVGSRVPKQRKFGMWLTQKGFQKEKSNKIKYKGIGIRQV